MAAAMVARNYGKLYKKYLSFLGLYCSVVFLKVTKTLRKKEIIFKQLACAIFSTSILKSYSPRFRENSDSDFQTEMLWVSVNFF